MHAMRGSSDEREVSMFKKTLKRHLGHFACKRSLQASVVDQNDSIWIIIPFILKKQKPE